MTAPPLPNFTPLPTHHCITGSILNIYHYHHVPITEDMLLGLGAGLGFIYWHQKGAPPILGGRANMERPGEKGLEKTIGERTGVTVTSTFTTSARKAQSDLLNHLAANDPIMLYVDMGYLPYLNLPKGFHFGGHAVVAAGYDPKTQHVLIADRDGVLHPIALADLAKARGSTYKPFPPRHGAYHFHFANPHAPHIADLWTAITSVVEGMRYPPISNLGVEGIRTAAKRIKAWPQKMTPDELVEACHTARIYITADGGTGGGIFRFMYARFLDEVAALTHDTRLTEIAGILRGIGNRWESTAPHFTEAANHPNPQPILDHIAHELSEIADCEDFAWQKLEERLLLVPA